MSALTPSEKQYWHDRLALLIDRALARLAADDPGLVRRLRREARSRAWQSLGLAELQAERAALAARQQALAARRRRLHRAMLAVVRRVPVDQVAAATDRLPAEVVRAVRRRRRAHEEELLAADERGRLLLELRRERRASPETVWLAGTEAAVLAVWHRLLGLLGMEPTPLQRQALAARAPTGP
jgi:hypothetical protein